jgi:hypothetical protein
MSTTDSLKPLLTIYKIDLLVRAPEPPTNHCSPLLTEHGTTDFQPLFANVKAVPGFPSTKRALFVNGITLLIPEFKFLLRPSIDLLPILELVIAAIDEILFPIAGQTVAG